MLPEPEIVKEGVILGRAVSNASEIIYSVNCVRVWVSVVEYPRSVDCKGMST